MSASHLADLVVVVHFLYVLGVVCGFLLILVGGLRGWRWVRNRVFRALHLLATLVVPLQALWEHECPLTTWERDLRYEAGEGISEASFVGRLLHEWLFVDLPMDSLTWIYVGFGLLVVAATWFVPPQWRAGRVERPGPAAGSPEER